MSISKNKPLNPPRSFNPQEKTFMESTTNIKEKYCLKWSKVQVTRESTWRVALRIWLIGAREE